MITRIHADNFRCFTNFELRPQRMNLLLGDNGTGKTSVFEVLQLVRELTVFGGRTPDLFAFKKTLWDQREIQSFELDVDGPDGSFRYRLEILHRPEDAANPSIQAEKVELGGKPLYRYGGGEVHLFDDNHAPGAIFPFDSNQSFLPHWGSQNAKLQWFKSFVAGISIFQLNPFAMDLFSQRDEPYLTLNGSNFVSWLRYLNDEFPQAKVECEKQLAEILPGFQRFRFQTMGDRKALVADFQHPDGTSYGLLLNQLSEGQRIVAILYSVLFGLGGVASTLCFDEPENFISLPEVQPWLQGLRDAIEDGPGQALVISHHPEVIDYLAPDGAFRFERPTGGGVRVRPWQPEPDLEDVMKPSEILARGG
ncbi:MAG: hypothetical protein D6696_00475 [Acidobacteria bacterium]|nr:MAG: hypothetical protein D6696_00475 [Acidobacteriota bacterium]